MTEHNLILEAARKLREQHRVGTSMLADYPYRQPCSIYTDSKLFVAEKEKIFESYPQLLCFSSDLPGLGTFLTLDELGVPILLTRDKNGKVFAFLNACSHRGARLKDGCGRASSLSCPYHAWNFQLDGRLKQVHHENAFGEINRAFYNLKSFPVEEKYGMIFCSLNKNEKLSVDQYIGGLSAYLQELELGGAVYTNGETRTVSANWKLAMEGYAEIYHLDVLHRNSVPQGKTSLIYERFGMDQRHRMLAFSNESILEEGLSDADLVKRSHFNFIIYPNVCLAVTNVSILLFQLYQGKTVNEHTTRFRCYRRHGVDPKEFDQQGDFEATLNVTFGEDYRLCAKTQRNLDTNLKSFNTFGRNEFALIDLHKIFLRDVGINPEEARLENGV